MKIKQVKIPVRKLVEGYEDNPETNQVVGYSGKLNIRPALQRQFVYKDAQRDEVIRTIKKGFPLSSMYWSKAEDGWELLDGQQRSISICQYVNGDFALDYRFFHNLNEEEKNQILDYELDVYQCEGSNTEKLEWFKVINIAGEKLTDQELRNAVYCGSWLSDAKKKFSAPNCAAYRLAKDYMAGTPIRQDYLEAVITWIAAREGKTIEMYMAEHQHDENADVLWEYFKKVIEWTKSVFTKYRKEMKGLPWGLLYNEFSGKYYSASDMENEIVKLMIDDDVTKKKGIYEYLLSGKKREKCLSIREFSESIKRAVYEKQGGICPHCAAEGGATASKVWEYEEMEADHITPWHDGGKTLIENCQMLCKQHNRTKSGK